MDDFFRLLARFEPAVNETQRLDVLLNGRLCAQDAGAIVDVDTRQQLHRSDSRASRLLYEQIERATILQVEFDICCDSALLLKQMPPLDFT